MKPFLLLTLDYPPRLGGVAAYLARFADQFPPDGLAVLAPDEGDVTHEADMASPVPIYRQKLCWSRMRPGWLPALYWTDRLCRREPLAGIVVSHLLPCGQIAHFEKRRRGLPYAVFVHGFDVALAAQSGGRKRAAARQVLANADLVVANSGYTSQLAKALGAAPERLVIAQPSPNILPDQSLGPEGISAMRARFAAPDDFLLLSVGRLVARKGFDSCLKAVTELRRGGLPVRYAVIGDGPDQARLQRLAAELGVAEAVTFAGSMAQQDLPAAFAACDAFAMVPRGLGADVEGFGIVYLEAAACGKPAIGSRSGGVPEAVLDNETGLLVDPLDGAALAAAIRRLFDDRAFAARLGDNGRKRVANEFGWKRSFRTVLERLEEIARR